MLRSEAPAKRLTPIVARNQADLFVADWVDASTEALPIYTVGTRRIR